MLHLDGWQLAFFQQEVTVVVASSYVATIQSVDYDCQSKSIGREMTVEMDSKTPSQILYFSAEKVFWLN